MEKAHDAFVAFVDMLSSALTQERQHTESIAAQVGLSRSHFSRLVTAASGEPPAALRRRILLERAAYLLATTDATILDVAVESGYSSHEAFTRAFSAAYGLAPRRWRMSPTRLQIDAPNRVHFHPPASLLLPARRKVTGMDLVVRILEHNVWLTDEMLRRCEGLSAQVLDRPIELSVEGVDADPTLRSLLARLVGQLEMWNAAFAGQPYISPHDTPTVFELRRRLAVVGPEFLSQVRGVTEAGRLDEAVVCPGDQVEVYSYGGVVAHIITYAAHRRILAAGALNDAGHTDLDEDPVRWISATA
jgi:AraC family transcriptional regulator